MATTKYDTSGSARIRLRFYMDMEKMSGDLYPRLQEACTNARFTLIEAVCDADVGAAINDSDSVQTLLFFPNCSDDDFLISDGDCAYDTYDVAADLEVKVPFRMMADRISTAFRAQVQKAANVACDALLLALSDVGAVVHEDSLGASFVLCSCWPAMY